jgi:plasmid maintenance system antidote protein VapI
MRKKGLLYKELGEHFGITPARAWKICNDADPEGTWRVFHKGTEAGVNRKIFAFNLREEGKTYREIAETLGVSNSRAQQLCVAGRRLKQDISWMTVREAEHDLNS